MNMKTETIYVLNSPILTSEGVYRYTEISKEEAKEILSKNKYVSAIGHEATAKMLTQLLGLKIDTNRISITMQTDDKAIVFRILTRLPEGKILTEEELKNIDYAFWLLVKEE